jgi:hypothetical protein
MYPFPCFITSCTCIDGEGDLRLVWGLVGVGRLTAATAMPRTACAADEVDTPENGRRRGGQSRACLTAATVMLRHAGESAAGGVNG